MKTLKPSWFQSKSQKYSPSQLRLQIGHFRHRWVRPILSGSQLMNSIGLYKRYLSDWSKYKRLSGSEPLDFLNSYPCLFDRTTTSPFDSHYFYQDIWAFKLIQSSNTPRHVDIGSRVILIGMLTAITQTVFIDIRPLLVTLNNFQSQPASILAIPFRDNSVESLSCLHVAEHIGLGRYGDLLNPEGTKMATRELVRVLAPGGKLYFSGPVGRPRLCFNAHRIHSPSQIMNYFQDLELIQFSGIDDSGRFREIMNPDDLANADYACGLFYFTKPAASV